MEQTEPTSPSLPPKKQPKPYRPSYPFSGLFSLITLLLLIVVLLGYMLLLPRTQTYLVRQGMNFLAKKMETRISADSIYVDIFNDIVLKNLYVEDWDCDTLLFAQYCHIDVSQIALLQKKLEINGIVLTQPYVRLERSSHDNWYNLNYLLNNLKSAATTNTDTASIPIIKLPNNSTPTTDTTATQQPKAPSITLKVEYLTLNQPRFVLNDYKSRLLLNVALQKVHTDIDQIDLDNEHLKIEKLLLQAPQIALHIPPKTEPDNKPDDYKTLLHITPETWKVNLQNAQLQQGEFQLKDGANPTFLEKAINFKMLQVSNINLDADNIYIGNDTITAKITQIELAEHSGFKVNSGEADFLLTPRMAEFSNLNIQTPHSTLGNYAALKFKTINEFKDFRNRVKLDIRLASSKITFQDIVYFAPQLYKIKPITDNLNRPIKISGNLYDRIDKLRIEDINLAVLNSSLRGNVRFFGLNDLKSANIDFKVASLHTSTADIKTFLPNIQLKNAERFGKISFSGYFSGFTTDFVAEGKFNTDLGQITSDIKMDLKQAIPRYSGNVITESFALGKILDEEKLLGNTSFNLNVNGEGLKLDQLNADIRGTIKHIAFKGYDYNNISVNGNINRKKFDGKFALNDANAQLSFNGILDFNTQIPTYAFEADIRHADLKALNLITDQQLPENLIVIGKTKLDFSGSKLEDLVGTGEFYDLTLNKGGKSFTLKKLTADIAQTEGNRRKINLSSDILQAKVEGDFQYNSIVNAIKNYLNTYFPYRFQYTTPTPAQDLVFDITLKDPIAASQLFLPKLQSLKYASIKGQLNTTTRNATLDADIPALCYDNIWVNNIAVEANSTARQINFDAKSSEVMLQDSTIIYGVYATGTVANDSIDYQLKVGRDDRPNRATAHGIIFANSDTLKMNLYNTSLVINNKAWETQTGTFVYKNKNYFLVENIVLTQDSQKIALQSLPHPEYKNLTQFALSNFKIKDFQYIKTIESLGLAGDISGNVTIQDLFGQQTINADIMVDSLVFLKQPLGDTRLEAIKQKNDSKLALKANIQNDNYVLTGDGSYRLPQGKGDDGELDVKLDINKAPLSFINAFVGSFVSDVEGNVSGKVNLSGRASRPNFDGYIFVRNGATTVDYLQTRYQFHNQKVVFQGKKIEFNQIPINDRDKNTAIVNGYINLNDFKNILLNVTLSSNRFLFMDTRYTDNELFYGTAYGGGEINFFGSTSNLNMVCNAQSKSGTAIYLPMSYSDGVGDNSIYSFVSRDTTKKVKAMKSWRTPPPPFLPSLGTPPVSTTTSMNMEFNLDITNDAEIQIILDQQAGDIMKARGNGNIQMKIQQTGSNTGFNMYGQYVIDQGSYLFTFQNLVNKHFQIAKGGTINFAGSPYDAKLNVNAIYTVRTSRYEIFSENEKEEIELLPSLSNSLRRRVPMDVKLNLSGSLTQPDINFAIDQVENTDDMADRMFEDKKDALFTADVNELNKQVVGLLLLNRFMPPDQIKINIGVSSVATVSELLSTYVSNFLNDAISNVIPDSELNLNWRNYQTESTPLDNSQNRNEIDVNFTKRLFDDRLSFNIGGNLDVGEKQLEEAKDNVVFIYDFVIVYNITADGRLRLKAFSEINDGAAGRNRIGTSISATKEFNSFKELLPKQRKKNKQEKQRRLLNLFTPRQEEKQEP